MLFNLSIFFFFQKQYIENMQSKIKQIQEVNNILLARKVQLRLLRQKETNKGDQ
jgi:hypothetical protein